MFLLSYGCTLVLVCSVEMDNIYLFVCSSECLLSIYPSAFSLAPCVFCTEAPLYVLWLGQIGVSEELFSNALVKGRAGTLAILLIKVCTSFSAQVSCCFL